MRQERERRQISLASIAENTKISRSLLAALERDDVSRWPTGIFRRSFVRSYATAIGLDPEQVVKQFLERFPDPSDVPPAPLVVPNHDASLRAERSDTAPDRVELVLRVSVPRSWASWLERVLRRTQDAIPGRQSM